VSDPPTSAPATGAHPPLGYAEAVHELEAILAGLEDDDVDVDHLAAQVRRAAELIALCRDRIADARVEVTQIVADLDDDDLP
jgi:exodeoxyribonuclease VII small subunit